MLIRSVLQWFGPEGEKLEELTLCDVDTGKEPSQEQMTAELKEPEPMTVFLGVIQIPVGINDSSGKMIDVRPQEMRFPLDANTRKQAFEKFAETAQNVVNDLKKRQEERANKASNGLIVPNSAQSEAINKLKLVTE